MNQNADPSTLNLINSDGFLEGLLIVMEKKKSGRKPSVIFGPFDGYKCIN